MDFDNPFTDLPWRYFNAVYCIRHLLAKPAVFIEYKIAQLSKQRSASVLAGDPKGAFS